MTGSVVVGLNGIKAGMWLRILLKCSVAVCTERGIQMVKTAGNLTDPQCCDANQIRLSVVSIFYVHTKCPVAPRKVNR